MRARVVLGVFEVQYGGGEHQLEGGVSERIKKIKDEIGVDRQGKIEWSP